MDSPPPPQRNISTSARKRPKLQKSLSTSGVNPSGGGNGGGGRGRGNRGASRGGGRGSRGGMSRKSSIARKSIISPTTPQEQLGSPSSSTAATPAPTSPSVPSTPGVSVPPTPRGEFFDTQLTTNSPESNNLEEKDKDNDEDDEENDEFAMDLDLHMQAQMKRSKEELRALLENFSEEQLQRYEVYRRSSLSKPNVKRLVGQILNQPCSPTMAFVIAGFTKVYIGEIVELAREIQKDWNQTGPLTPEHLREANRRYKQATGFTSSNYHKRLF
ncbi:5227_t:CDS:2 [Ambispora leptoticha]|uniref:Transcription initiation factor TFIID subunit 11 n=1 Tax=Ambispora leptoticha TaxID=144679 RepID=A0A9N9ATR8_9GLOM|nr:5227_t:CDS:2 [Ambispora leptoticha]